mgnify:CR=1 FL=1
MTINLPYFLISVAIMALVTYLPRMLPLVIFRKKIQNHYIRSFLSYVPYAVLAAMTFPAIFSAGKEERIFIFLTAALAGLVVALILAYHQKGLLTVALSASAAVFLAELLMKLAA